MEDLTPPSELVQQWLSEFFGCTVSGELSHSERFLATRAAQWGADQELEACCEWVAVESIVAATELRAWRRPEPPSLKEQALARTAAILNDPNRALLIEVRETLELTLRALEALP